MNFSGRVGAHYVSLGAEAERRACSVHSDGAAADIEAFLGRRIQGFTAVVRVLAGTGTLGARFAGVPFEAGDVLVVPPGAITHRFRGAHHVEVHAIGLPAATHGAIVRAADLPAGTFERDDAALLRALQAAPQRVGLDGSPIHAALMAALRAIERDPSRARLQRIAHEIGYTADGLTTLMERETGHGFARWRDAITMAFVRRRLPQASLTAIARELGVDRSYVHRRFKRAHGATPAAWRASPDVAPRILADHWDTIDRLMKR